MLSEQGVQLLMEKLNEVIVNKKILTMSKEELLQAARKSEECAYAHVVKGMHECLDKKELEKLYFMKEIIYKIVKEVDLSDASVMELQKRCVTQTALACIESRHCTAMKQVMYKKFLTAPVTYSRREFLQQQQQAMQLVTSPLSTSPSFSSPSSSSSMPSSSPKSASGKFNSLFVNIMKNQHNETSTVGSSIYSPRSASVLMSSPYTYITDESMNDSLNAITQMLNVVIITNN